MIRRSRDAHPDAEVKLPIRTKIVIDCRDDLLLLLVNRIKAGDVAGAAVIFQAKL